VATSGVEECYGVMGPGGRNVCGVTVEVAEGPGGCVYRRAGGPEALVPSCRVLLYPVAPLLYPERLTGYVMIALEKPVLLAPGEAATFCAVIGHDVAVAPYTGEKGEGGLVDAFPVGKAKYALYGPPSRGVLARWAPSQPLPCGEPPRCGMQVRVEARNASTAPIALRRVVYPASAVPLAYSGCRVIGPRVSVTATTAATARVTVEPPRVPPGWRLAPSPYPRPAGVVAPLPWGEQKIAFIMQYGL